MEITKIVVNGDKILAYGKIERTGFRKPTEGQIENSGGFLAQFEKILPTWYGFGIGIKDGKYYRIDLINHEIQSEMSLKAVKADLYCMFVPEDEFSGIPKDLKFEIKGDNDGNDAV